MKDHLTKQQVFDKVADHLARQKEQSRITKPTLHGFICAYRGDDGKKCAVGALIPDEVWEEHGIDEATWGGNSAAFKLFTDFPELKEKSGLGAVTTNFLAQLQTVHDALDMQWGLRLYNLAEDNSLSFDRNKFERDLADLEHTL